LTLPLAATPTLALAVVVPPAKSGDLRGKPCPVEFVVC
jgi:hypothetical protein